MLQYNLFSCKSAGARYAVLLHGFGGNYRVWKYQIPLLQEKYNVVTIDLPSHNDKNIKLSQMEISIENVVREIIEVLDSLKIKKAVFMGVSLGCAFIKHLEYFYPEYVERAVFAGAVSEVGLFLRVVAAVFSRIGDKLPFKLVYGIFSKVLMPWRVSKKSREIFCKCAKVLNRKEFRAYMYIFRECFSFVKRFTEDTYEQNLYIVGSGDLCFIKGARSEAERTGAELIELEDCGHVCNIDRKEQFNCILSEALGLSCEMGERKTGVASSIQLPKAAGESYGVERFL